MGRGSVKGSGDKSSNKNHHIPELEVLKIKGKCNVVSEDLKPSLITSEDNMKVHCFVIKQKTAYEIYQCDWSSDVCSSDLPAVVGEVGEVVGGGGGEEEVE